MAAEQLHALLKTNFGYDNFRPMQEDIIRHAIDGADAVVLMPTGGGKSMCYQLPALALDGLTLVISPLIALMHDQVQALQANGIASAYLNSSLTAMDERAIMDTVEAGDIKLLYVSPERLLSQGFLDWIGRMNLALVAIDEAHCISSWGHHFRPEYQRLHVLKEHFPEVPVMALTATADRAVRGDIAELLKLKEPRLFVSSFDRPNLTLSVLPGRKKWEQLQVLLRKYPDQSGIIYCQSRKNTEALAGKLKDLGIKAGAYHAGLSAEVRRKTQEGFIQGQVDVICATIAFGMGIDKPNVRFVVHYNMPGNLESYYQEIGRAGRDGLPSDTVLFYSYRDVQTHLGFMADVTVPAYKEILEAKLKRMQEFAEAQVCRRNILLSYFSEMPEKPCGSCDVCINPPQYFDGTIHAQMTLSALTRLKESVGMSTLIDVLKGTMSDEVRAGGYHQVKTFGVGRKTTGFAWQLFIQQFLQQGFLEIDYKDHYHLKLTPLSKEVLYDGRKVDLVTPETIKERQEQQKKVRVAKTPRKALSFDEGLLDELKELRRTFAAKIRKPAYVVFSDAALQDMAARKPSNTSEFLAVHGVGEHKANRYGEAFMAAIADYEGR